MTFQAVQKYRNVYAFDQHLMGDSNAGIQFKTWK